MVRDPGFTLCEWICVFVGHVCAPVHPRIPTYLCKCRKKWRKVWAWPEVWMTEWWMVLPPRVLRNVIFFLWSPGPLPPKCRLRTITLQVLSDFVCMSCYKHHAPRLCRQQTLVSLRSAGWEQVQGMQWTDSCLESTSFLVLSPAVLHKVKGTTSCLRSL